MKKLFAKIWFFFSGWKLDIKFDLTQHPKSVMIAAPHTSNWDFIYAMCSFWLMDIDLKFFIKDSYTKPWYGGFFKAIGAIGVNRSKTNNLVEHSIDILNASEELVLLIPAEGTRSKVEKWKMGFYHIAKGTNLPIMLGYLDFKTKTAGVAKIMHLSDDLEKDMKEIEQTYLNYTGKNPEKYNPKIY